MTLKRNGLEGIINKLLRWEYHIPILSTTLNIYQTLDCRCQCGWRTPACWTSKHPPKVNTPIIQPGPRSQSLSLLLHHWRFYFHDWVLSALQYFECHPTRDLRAMLCHIHHHMFKIPDVQHPHSNEELSKWLVKTIIMWQHHTLVHLLHSLWSIFSTESKMAPDAVLCLFMKILSLFNQGLSQIFLPFSTNTSIRPRNHLCP
jgi:hypothetical protein